MMRDDQRRKIPQGKVTTVFWSRTGTAESFGCFSSCLASFLVNYGCENSDSRCEMIPTNRPPQRIPQMTPTGSNLFLKLPAVEVDAWSEPLNKVFLTDLPSMELCAGASRASDSRPHNE